MAFDGSGNFNLTYNWVDDYNLAILIDPTRMMGQENDMAGGLSLCITRDGQGVPSANIGWNNFRLTDLANPVLAGDATNLGYSDARYMRVNGSNAATASINAGTFTIINVGTPVNPTDAVTKSYVDTATLARNMANFQINNLGAPTSAGDAATKTYVDAVAATGSAAVSLVSSTLIVNYFGGF